MGCKGVEVGGEVQLKWEKELELRRDTIGVGEKWVKYARGVGTPDFK